MVYGHELLLVVFASFLYSTVTFPALLPQSWFHTLEASLKSRTHLGNGECTRLNFAFWRAGGRNTTYMNYLEFLCKEELFLLHLLIY
jgi:hypothetical protein